jgi:hypothetical protein
VYDDCTTTPGTYSHSHITEVLPKRHTPGWVVLTSHVHSVRLGFHFGAAGRILRLVAVMPGVHVHLIVVQERALFVIVAPAFLSDSRGRLSALGLTTKHVG